MKVLVYQGLSCYDVRLVARHQVARWIHLFGVRFFVRRRVARWIGVPPSSGYVYRSRDWEI